MKPKIAAVDPPVPVPPRPLGEAGSALWRRVQSAYNVTDAGGVELLVLACEATDRATSLRAAIAEDGEVLRNPGGGIREHPCLKAEMACMAFTVRTLQRLGLDVEPLRAHAGRPSTPAGISWRQP